jgi:hypothetical protein
MSKISLHTIYRMAHKVIGLGANNFFLNFFKLRLKLKIK